MSKILVEVASKGHSLLVDKLISYGANIDHRDKYGFTALLLASTHGHIDTVTILIHHGADIHCKTLIWAAYSGHTHIVTLLLKLGADINCKNTWGDTALRIAQHRHHTHIVDIINDYAVKKE